MKSHTSDPCWSSVLQLGWTWTAFYWLWLTNCNVIRSTSRHHTLCITVHACLHSPKPEAKSAAISAHKNDSAVQTGWKKGGGGIGHLLLMSMVCVWLLAADSDCNVRLLIYNKNTRAASVSSNFTRLAICTFREPSGVFPFCIWVSPATDANIAQYITVTGVESMSINKNRRVKSGKAAHVRKTWVKKEAFAVYTKAV